MNDNIFKLAEKNHNAWRNDIKILLESLHWSEPFYKISKIKLDELSSNSKYIKSSIIGNHIEIVDNYLPEFIDNVICYFEKIVFDHWLKMTSISFDELDRFCRDLNIMMAAE